MADTKNDIIVRMLNVIDDKYDKNIGGFYYDNISAVATELVDKYKNQDEILKNAFAGTAELQYLKIIAAERGVVWRDATKANGTVTFNVDANTTINAGELVASELQNYVSTETKTSSLSGELDINVECENAGSIGNALANTITQLPVNIPGVNSVTNKSAFTNGYDAETRDELLRRYYENVLTPPTSGNKWHYLAWAKAVSGVKDSKIKPLWNGNGTVKVVVIDTNGQPASTDLINNVSSFIEKNRPIGATVTVVAPTKLIINVNATIEYKTGYNKNTVLESGLTLENQMKANIESYLGEISFTDETFVRYTKIGCIINDVEGVKDYSNLTLNGGTANITIRDTTTVTEVPFIGTFTIN